MGAQFSLIIVPLLGGALATQTIIMGIIFPNCGRISLSHLFLGILVGAFSTGISQFIIPL